jgi:hypothetical protein
VDTSLQHDIFRGVDPPELNVLPCAHPTDDLSSIDIIDIHMLDESCSS